MKGIYLIVLLWPFLGICQKQHEVFFDFNKDVPNEASVAELNRWMTTNKTAEIIEISGYCDSVDDSRYNQDLAMRRINTVLSLLKKEAITISDKVALKPFGKDFKFSKKQEENRKVVFRYRLKEHKTENQIGQDAITDVREEIVSAVPISALVEKERIGLAAKFKKAKKGDLVRINNINFLFNSEKIEEQSMPILEELLDILYNNPKLRIAIHGHICCNPSGEDTKLSYRRALVIFKYLAQNEIPLNRMSYKGFGSNDPIYKVPERNEAQRKANRRVEILIVDK